MRFVFHRGSGGRGWWKVERRIMSRVTCRTSEGSSTRDRRRAARTLPPTVFAENRKWKSISLSFFLQTSFYADAGAAGTEFSRITGKIPSGSSEPFPDRVSEWWGKGRGKLFCPPYAWLCGIGGAIFGLFSQKSTWICTPALFLRRK